MKFSEMNMKNSLWDQLKPTEQKILRYLLKNTGDSNQQIVKAKFISQKLRINRGNLSRYLETLKFLKILKLINQDQHTLVKVNATKANHYFQSSELFKFEEEMRKKDSRIYALENTPTTNGDRNKLEYNRKIQTFESRMKLCSKQQDKLKRENEDLKKQIQDLKKEYQDLIFLTSESKHDPEIQALFDKTLTGDSRDNEELSKAVIEYQANNDISVKRILELLHSGDLIIDKGRIIKSESRKMHET